MEYQMAKKLLELKKDVDTQISQNKASVAPTTSVAGQSGSLESWITSNDSRGASGADGGFQAGTGLVDAPTDGTQRALQEDFLKSVLQQIYANTRVDASVAYFGPFQLNQATAVLTGIAQPVNQVNNKAVTIVASADIYKSPWGQIMLKPSRNVRERSVPILNTGYWKVGYLRPFQVRKLAKTGDSEKRQAIVQYTLVGRNEKSSGIIADLTTS